MNKHIHIQRTTFSVINCDSFFTSMARYIAIFLYYYSIVVTIIKSSFENICFLLNLLQLSFFFYPAVLQVISIVFQVFFSKFVMNLTLTLWTSSQVSIQFTKSFWELWSLVHLWFWAWLNILEIFTVNFLNSLIFWGFFISEFFRIFHL